MRRSPVGRSGDLARLASWLSDPASPRVLALTGEGGIGKTTVAAAALAAAADDGWATLEVSCTRADARLPLSGYADLAAAAERLAPEVLETLTPPQRYAAELALQRRQPDDRPADPLALAASLHGILAGALGPGRLLVCVDDLPWMDSDTATALAYAVRRLPADRFRLVVTLRDVAAGSLLADLHRDDVRQVPLAALSRDQLALVVEEAVGWEPTEAVLTGLAGAARGNPLFAIELARGLGAARPVLPPDRWQATAAAVDVLGPRLTELGPAAFDATLLVAMTGGLLAEVVASVVGPGAVEAACRKSVLQIEAGRVSMAHPLIEGLALARADPARLAELARAVAPALEPLAGLRLRASATLYPDSELAAELDGAADAMAARGALSAAADLAREACRLTPARDPGRPARVVRTARMDLASGHPEATIDRLTAEWESLDTGDLRADAHLLIGMASPPAEDLASLDRALAEVESDATRVRILLRKALLLAVGEASDIPTARALVAQAEALLGPAGDPADVAAAATIGAWVDVLGGAGTRRSVHPEPPGEMLHEVSLRRPLAVLQASRGEIADARRAWNELRDEAAAGGQAISALVFAAHLFELAIRVGDVPDAERWLVEFADLPDSEEPDRVRRRFRADLAAARGDAAEAIRQAEAVLADPETQGWDVVAAQRARGVGELAAGRYAEAVATLAAVRERCERAGIGEPGIFPVDGDLVEALLAVDDLAGARAVLDRLAACTTASPWATLTLARGRALATLAEGYAEQAAVALAATADGYAEQGLLLDAARTRLSLGRALRRGGKRAAARTTLAEAESGFAALGCDGWAARAAEELAALSGRRTAEGLTEAEERVARLAAEGLSNREIARRLMISPHTVETHLSRVYRKLGVRARSQLVHHLA